MIRLVYDTFSRCAYFPLNMWVQVRTWPLWIACLSNLVTALKCRANSVSDAKSCSSFDYYCRQSYVGPSGDKNQGISTPPPPEGPLKEP